MEKLCDALFGTGGLLRVRSILAYAFTGFVGYLTVDGQVGPEVVLPVATTIAAFYFGTRAGQG